MSAALRLIAVILTICMGVNLAARAERPDVRWQLGGHTFRINDLAVSPCGTLIASASEDGTLKVWNMADGRLTLTVTLPSDSFMSAFAMYGVTFSPEGDTVCAASVGGGYAWRLSDGALVDTFGLMESAGQVLFSRDGQLMALAGSPAGSEDTTAVFRRSDGQLLHTFEPAGSIAAVFSADSQFLIAGTSMPFVSTAGVIRYFRLSDGAVVNTVSAHNGPITWLALSADGMLVASSGEDHLIKIWNALDGTFVRSLAGHTGAVYRVKFAPDGTTLASTGFDGTVRLWNAASGDLIDTFSPTGQGLGGLAWSVDGQSLAVSAAPAFFEPHHSFRRISVSTGATLHRFLDFGEGLLDLSVSPDGGRFAVSVYISGDIEVRNVSDGSLITAIGTDVPGQQVAFSADGTRLAAGGQDGIVRFFDAATGAMQQSLNAHAPGFTGIDDIILSLDGQTMATRRFNEPGRIFNYPDLTLRALLPAASSFNASFCFTPDSQAIVTAGAAALPLNSASDGGLIRFLSGHASVTADVAVSADGTRIVSGSNDWTARLWDAQSGAFLRSFEGHTAAVSAVAITSDGGLVATGTLGSDRRLRLWNAETGAVLASYDVDVGTGPGRIEFTPDDRTILCLRNDGTVMAIDNPFAGIAGDVDGDGDVDLDDGAALAAVLIDAPLDPGHAAGADVNGDGSADGRDVAEFVARLLGG